MRTAVRGWVVCLRIIFGFLLFFGLVQSADAGGDPMGPWLTEDGSAIVRIASCGRALCGTIVRSQKTTDARGEKLCGMAVLGDAVSTGPASWGKGWIYSPKANGRYPVDLSLPGDGKLHLHVSAGLFGRDQVWTRPTQTFATCTP
jgi:uncharacterized protein (DUF2147 family)